MTTGLDLSDLWEQLAGLPAELRFAAAPKLADAMEALLLEYLDTGRTVTDVQRAETVGMIEAFRAASSSESIAAWRRAFFRDLRTDPTSEVEAARRRGGLKVVKALSGSTEER